MLDKDTNVDKASDMNDKETATLDTPQIKETYGYELYPERKGDSVKRTWWRILIGLEGGEYYDKLECEKNIYECTQSSPIVKLLMGALKSAGCPIDLQRHFTCEICNKSVTGGYDTNMNQIVVCQNNAPHRDMVQSVLAHEMIHMFDYCTNDADFKNLDHLACTEIRAANMAHCSFTSAWIHGFASFTDVKGSHKRCVKDKAIASVLAARKVTPEVAEAAVERVFTKCYNDLEPIGRRVRRNSMDMVRAYDEGRLYGYEL